MSHILSVIWMADTAVAPTEEIRARAVPAEYTAVMDEDLNLAVAIAVVHATLKRLNTTLAAAAPQEAEVTEAALDLRAQLEVLGLDPLSEPWRSSVLTSSGEGTSAAMDALDHLVTGLLDQRSQARAARDWARATGDAHP